MGKRVKGVIPGGCSRMLQEKRKRQGGEEPPGVAKALEAAKEADPPCPGKIERDKKITLFSAQNI